MYNWAYCNADGSGIVCAYGKKNGGRYHKGKIEYRTAEFIPQDGTWYNQQSSVRYLPDSIEGKDISDIERVCGKLIAAFDPERSHFVSKDDDVDFYLNNTLLRALFDAIHFIRKLGNQAVHQGNLTKAEALEVLKRLHFVMGEACIFLDLICEYPAFDENIESMIGTQPRQDIPEELSVEQKIILAFSKQLRGVHSFSEKKEIVNVHIATKKANKPTQQTRNIDPAANTKAAFQNVHEWLEERLHTKITADYTKSLLVVPSRDNVVILAVRSGCSNLRNKDTDGNWTLLSGIDYVAYAPDLKHGLHATEQLRVFSREEYIDMWKSLDLIRYKVSSQLSRRLKQFHGQSYTITAAQYADVASVQSFTNSGKKKRAVNEYFVMFPLLSSDGFDKLLQ